MFFKKFRKKSHIIKNLLLTIGIFLFLLNIGFSACDYDPELGIDPIKGIETCLNGSDLVKPDDNLDLGENGFQDTLLGWIKNIALYLSAGAVFGIVYGSLLLTLNLGEDEKIKKGKDVIKWSIVGFLGVVFASTLITIVINFIYSLS